MKPSEVHTRVLEDHAALRERIDAIDAWRVGERIDQMLARLDLSPDELIGRLSLVDPQDSDIANAMKGNRERCLKAGMHGDVSKPVKRQPSFAEIDRVIGAV